jgi:ethanolamine utilization protein EutA (predicted chaperonin)
MKKYLFFISILYYTSILGQTQIPEKELKEFTNLLYSNAYGLSGSEYRSVAGAEIESLFLKLFKISKEDENY